MIARGRSPGPCLAAFAIRRATALTRRGAQGVKAPPPVARYRVATAFQQKRVLLGRTVGRIARRRFISSAMRRATSSSGSSARVEIHQGCPTPMATDLTGVGASCASLSAHHRTWPVPGQRPLAGRAGLGRRVGISIQAWPSLFRFGSRIWRKSAGELARISRFGPFFQSPPVMFFTRRISVAPGGRWSCARSRGGDWHLLAGQRRADPWPGCGPPAARPEVFDRRTVPLQRRGASPGPDRGRPGWCR